MWIESFHRFPDEAAFLAACDAAGWPRGPDGQPGAGEGFQMDVIGPGVLAPAVVAGQLVPGPVDPRWHVNLVRGPAVMLPAAFAAAEIVPEAPYRTFAHRDPDAALAAAQARYSAAQVANAADPRLAPEPERPPPPVPEEVPAWAGRAVLEDAGLLSVVEATVAAADVPVQTAWAAEPTWTREGPVLVQVADAIGLPGEQVDAMFREAGARAAPPLAIGRKGGGRGNGQG